MSNEKDSVPGLGYKDKETAEKTIEALEGRDVDYQKLAVKGLIGRAKRTLRVTKAEEKVTNINAAISFFENWLKEFEEQKLPNWGYLPLTTIEVFIPLGEKYKIAKETDEFIDAFRKAEGDYKKLRTVTGEGLEKTWDIVRNNNIRDLLKTIKEKNADLWDENEMPTKVHVQLILWAYSPETSKINKKLYSLKEKIQNEEVDNHETKRKIDDKNEENKSKKRKISKSDKGE